MDRAVLVAPAAGCIVCLWAGPDSVTVSAVAELIKTIAPDAYIILAPDTYNFSTITEEEIADCSNYVDKDYLLKYENLMISDVTGLTLRGLTCGHEVERGKCDGSVLYAEDCKNLTIEDCRLYGCGTDGIWTQRVDGLTVTGTEIYECTHGLVYLFHTDNVTFRDCNMHDSTGYDMI